MESPTHATRILEAIDGRFAQHSRRSVRVFPQRLGRPGVPRVRGEGAAPRVARQRRRNCFAIQSDG